jgi:hypothetical protein
MKLFPRDYRASDWPATNHIQGTYASHYRRSSSTAVDTRTVGVDLSHAELSTEQRALRAPNIAATRSRTGDLASVPCQPGRSKSALYG